MKESLKEKIAYIIYKQFGTVAGIGEVVEKIEEIVDEEYKNMVKLNIKTEKLQPKIVHEIEVDFEPVIKENNERKLERKDN